jgi:hypothetical protein
MARTKQTAKKTTDSKASVKQLATKAAMASAPSAEESKGHINTVQEQLL